ncbi:DNA mismatch repair protein MutS [Pseudoclostridium thermosuccinogenes]|uniref:DNA mismatch repair protein MutS n=1 Tax=Clostridium thermosuccinogenes TaxID=84032 RepID=UPI000CCBFE94|nr:DNA mismatch repair protein MutS [Pseudoclostridium thermosuccinogenes]PNT92781.1 DNA mismatch repair protein MutS [Pseudoclostridium thermosuccinogenes]
MASVTPMMQQYLDIKEQYKDCILFFRLGDFYEMFFKDAEIASKELEITLTGKDCGLPERAPMCGVPYHAADSYISKLINKGYKVAICEQLEDPALAKGIVKRDVIRIVTPGTVIDSSMLDEKKNNYLVSVYKYKYYFSLAIVDITTGEFLATQINWGNTIGKLTDELAKFSPSEIIVNSEFFQDETLLTNIRKRFNFYISAFDDSYFEYGFAASKIKDKFGDCEILNMEYNLSVNAVGALLEYLEQTQKVNLDHIQSLNAYKIEEFMILDASTRRNLELTETMREKSRRGTLLWVLDKTVTSMGGRLLRKWIEQPLINIADINERLDAVDELKQKFMLRMELRELLKRVYDIERLMGKIILGNVNCRDLVALKNSIGQVPHIKNILKDCTMPLNVKIFERMDTLEDVYELIDSSIIDDPPITIKEGGIIKPGYNPEVDRLRKATTEGKDWVVALESSEREKTGIKNLKVGFNKVFGYYIEVTKSNLSLVPDNYIRKQTLANCERYITQELKEMEDSILGAESKIVDLEYQIFLEIKGKIAQEVARIKSTAEGIAEADALCSLAEVADSENYCRPVVDADEEIDIRDGRHPVVEKMLGQGSFVPNDTFLDMKDNRLAVITGPNMAGKSTYMRQTALIVLMAQIGSFVPAGSAKIGITDRIFTRVGASDDLAAGQSTFMVEMSEVSNILANATPRSLLILDEIGRGTSTFDGLSIAWAVIEYICDKNKIGCRTLFATHYHELTELEGKLTGIKNYCISVKEKGEDIIFLRKIIRGGADGSYGIQVARLAGLPQEIIDRAKEILNELEDSDISKKEKKLKKMKVPLEGQIDLFAVLGSESKQENEVLEEIKNIDITTLTPLDALNILYKLQQKARKP